MINFFVVVAADASATAAVTTTGIRLRCAMRTLFKWISVYRPADRIRISAWWQSFGPRSALRSSAHWLAQYLFVCDKIHIIRMATAVARANTILDALQSKQQSQLPRQRIYLFSQILFVLRFLPCSASCSLTHSVRASRILVCLMYCCVCVLECGIHACISCAIITTTILFIASVLHYLLFLSRSIPFRVCVCRLRLRVRFSFIFLSFDGFGLIFGFLFSCACAERS